jgi:hypothetical protein
VQWEGAYFDLRVPLKMLENTVHGICIKMDPTDSVENWPDLVLAAEK